MKNNTLLNALMIMSISILITIGVASCTTPAQEIRAKSYSEKTIDQFNDMKGPVTLFAKSEFWGQWGTSLKDGNGKIHVFGDMSTFSCQIGDTYEVGDTLKP